MDDLVDKTLGLVAFDRVGMEFGGDKGGEARMGGGSLRCEDHCKKSGMEGFAGLGNAVTFGAKIETVFARKHLCR